MKRKCSKQRENVMDGQKQNGSTYHWKQCKPEDSCVCATQSCLTLCHLVVSDSAIPWTVAHQTPLSMEFSWQEYWSGLPFPSPGDLPDPGIQLGSPTLQADFLPSEPPGKTDIFKVLDKGRWGWSVHLVFNTK